jgi:hypothetical protein
MGSRELRSPGATDRSGPESDGVVASASVARIERSEIRDGTCTRLRRLRVSLVFNRGYDTVSGLGLRRPPHSHPLQDALLFFSHRRSKGDSEQ